MKILQVSQSDVDGGAERIAWNLFHAYRAWGHASWMAVAYKFSDHPDVLRIPNERTRNPWAKGWWTLHARLLARWGRAYARSRLGQAVRGMAEPGSLVDLFRGAENFRFPGTRHLVDLSPERPTLIHGHNLHHNYFDLRQLPLLSRQVPLVLTLHDAWMLSGHCAHSFGCERWRTGCGECPDLAIHPAVRRDATAFNWQRKQQIYARSRLFIATPSRWLMDKVERSMLVPGIVDGRVIHNGIDLSIYSPKPKGDARAALGLDLDAHILLFAANGIRQNPWKDYRLLRTAVTQVAERLPQTRLVFLALGEDAPTERIGQAEIRFVPFQADPAAGAAYYQAADLYIHAARADTFPNTVLEALACGTPVVATAVGGIPEQVRSLDEGGRATGALVSPGDARGMSDALVHLLSNDETRRQLGENAATDARQRFDLNRQVRAYLDWYAEILQHPVLRT